MAYKAILFDMNGVLINDEHLQEEAFRKTLLQLNIPLTPEDYIRYFIGKTDHKGFEDYLHTLRLDQDLDPLIAKKSRLYQELTSNGIEGYPGVKQFIEAAIEHGLSLAVVTSSMKSEATSILAGLGLTHHFKSIIAADDVKNGKPDPEGYLKGAASLSVDPSECVVIEDAPSGLKAARSARMFSVAVLNTHETNELSDANIITKELSSSLINELF